MYATVIAHVEGNAVERVLTSTVSDTFDGAQEHTDRWTRHHARGELDANHLGFYAYTDRVSGARAPRAGSHRIASSNT